jgi:ribosomal-protein-alanine acetyltransferase
MASTKVDIRPASKEDLKELFRLEQLCFGAESFSRRQIRYLATRSSGFFFVLVEGEKIAGFIVLLTRKTSFKARIYSVAVSPDFRGKKYGATLLEKAVGSALKEGKKILSLEVSENNEAAIQLYLKFGFQITGKRKAYYKDGSDALLMSKTV